MWGFRLLIGGFFIVLPMFFIGAGATMAWRQHEKLSSWPAVEATVVAARVETHRGSKGSINYTPVVEYRYEVRGQTYTSKNVLPLNESAGSSWAHEIVRRYPVGSKTSAYYLRSNPSDAFLVHQYSFFPYLFMLFPMIHLSVGIGLVFLSGWGRANGRPDAPEPAGGSWFGINPARSLWQKLRGWLLMTLLWFGVGALAVGHFFLNASPPYGALAIGASTVYLALAMIPASGWLYYLLLMRRTSDPVVLTSTDRFRAGQEFQARIVQPIHRDTIVQEAKIGLVCDMLVKVQSGGKTKYDTVKEYEDWKPVLQNHTVRSGETIEQTIDIRIPDNQSPSSFNRYPCYRWKIEIRAALKDSPDYKAEFPILVEGHSAEG